MSYRTMCEADFFSTPGSKRIFLFEDVADFAALIGDEPECDLGCYENDHHAYCSFYLAAALKNVRKKRSKRALLKILEDSYTGCSCVWSYGGSHKDKIGGTYHREFCPSFVLEIARKVLK